MQITRHSIETTKGPMWGEHVTDAQYETEPTS